MENQIMQYTDEGASDPTINLGFTNYERLMLELNNRKYYPKETYEKFEKSKQNLPRPAKPQLHYRAA